MTMTKEISSTEDGMTKKELMLNAKAKWDTARENHNRLSDEVTRCSRAIRHGNEQAAAAFGAIRAECCEATIAEESAKNEWQLANADWQDSEEYVTA